MQSSSVGIAGSEPNGQHKTARGEPVSTDLLV